MFQTGQSIALVYPVKTAGIVFPRGTPGTIAHRGSMPSNPESNWVLVHLEGLRDPVVVRVKDIQISPCSSGSRASA